MVGEEVSGAIDDCDRWSDELDTFEYYHELMAHRVSSAFLWREKLRTSRKVKRQEVAMCEGVEKLGIIDLSAEAGSMAVVI